MSDDEDVALLAGLNSLTLSRYHNNVHEEYTQRGNPRDWRRFLPPNRGGTMQPQQQHYPQPNYPPQPYYPPPQHQHPQNFVPRPQNFGQEYPEIPQDNLASNVSFIPLPVVNGVPVGQNPLQYPGTLPPAPNTMPQYGGIQSGSFDMPSYEEEKKVVQSQFDLIMQEVKLLRRDVKKLTKIMSVAFPDINPVIPRERKVSSVSKKEEESVEETPTPEEDLSEITFKL